MYTTYIDDIPQYNCSPLKRFDLQMHFNYIKRILWLLWALVQYIAPLNHNCTFCRVYNDAFKKSTFFVSIHRALVWLAVLVAARSFVLHLSHLAWACTRSMTWLDPTPTSYVITTTFLHYSGGGGRANELFSSKDSLCLLLTIPFS